MNIPTLREGKRGCGFRKPGGTYLMSDGPMEGCDLLPVELTVCPTCGEGIKPARGWTWVEADPLLPPLVPGGYPEPRRKHGAGAHFVSCPLTMPVGRCGLIWIGAAFYKRPVDFMREAISMGVSRRISSVPKGFEAGKTLVLLAHREATTKRCGCTMGGKPTDPYGDRKPPEPDCDECGGVGEVAAAAIFSAFIPNRIEYVITGEESEEELEALVERGIRPVRVEPVDDQGQLGEAA